MELIPVRGKRRADLLACFWLCLAFLLVNMSRRGAAANCVNRVFARLGDLATRDTSSCGNRSQPCSTITTSLNNAQSSVTAIECIHVELLPSSYNVPLFCETLDSLERVSISGENAGTIPLGNMTCGLGLHMPWIQLNNCSDVSLNSLNVSLHEFSGLSAIHIILSYNISVMGSSFKYMPLNTSAIDSYNSVMVMIANSQFFGTHLRDIFWDTQGLIEEPNYRISAIIAIQRGNLGPDCADYGANNSASAPPCVSDIPAGSRLLEPFSYSVAVIHCSFRNLGIQPVPGRFYSVTRFQLGIAVYIGASNAIGFHVLVSNCTFRDVYSPYDSVVKMYSEGYGASGHFEISDCVFENGWAYIGGGLFLRVGHDISNVSLALRGSAFYNNTGFVEGGAVGLSFEDLGDEVSEDSKYPDPRRNALIEDCQFVDNNAVLVARISSGGSVAALYNGTSRSSTREAGNLPLLQISKTQFIRSNSNFGSAVLASEVRTEASDV